MDVDGKRNRRKRPEGGYLYREVAGIYIVYISLYIYEIYIRTTFNIYFCRQAISLVPATFGPTHTLVSSCTFVYSVYFYIYLD